MTRTKSLRMVDRDGGKGGWVSGGIVDESFPAEAVHRVLQDAGVAVCLEAFDGFLGRRLGRYRMIEAGRASAPAVATELRLLGELVETVEQLRARVDNLPPMTGAFLNQVVWQRRKTFLRDYARGLDAELGELRNMLWLTEREIEPYQDGSGRPTASNRDGLLCDVAVKLREAGLSKQAAAGCAAAVLRASGVHAPDDPKESARIVRRVESDKGGNNPA